MLQIVEGATTQLVKGVGRARQFNSWSPTYWDRINDNVARLKQLFYGICEGQIGAHNTGMKNSLIFHLPYHVVNGPQSLLD